MQLLELNTSWFSSERRVYGGAEVALGGFIIIIYFSFLEACCSPDRAIRDVEWICLRAFFVAWVELRLFGSSRPQCALGNTLMWLGFKNSLNPEVARTKSPKDGDLTSFHSLITDWKYTSADILTTQQLGKLFTACSAVSESRLRVAEERVSNTSQGQNRCIRLSAETGNHFAHAVVLSFLIRSFRETCSGVELTRDFFLYKHRQGTFRSSEVRDREKQDNLDTSKHTKPIKEILSKRLLEERLAQCMLGVQSYPPAALSA